MAADAMVDLRLRSEAIERRDAGLARAALAGPALAAALAEISAGASLRASADYHFDRLAAVLIPDPGNPQGSPRVGLHVQGSAGRATEPIPVDLTIGLRIGAVRYLIDSLPVSETSP